MPNKRNDSFNLSIAKFYIYDGWGAYKIWRTLVKYGHHFVGDEPISLPTVKRRLQLFEKHKDELKRYFIDGGISHEEANALRKKLKI